MKRFILTAAIASLALGSYAMAQSAHPGVHHQAEADEADEGAPSASLARVSAAEAQAIALNVRPGRITDHELEREAGGSGLRYSFDIVSHGKTFEVGVDARTGAVLENQEEGPNPD